MNYNTTEIENILKDILSIPSPTGCTKEIMNYIKTFIKKNNLQCHETNKGAIIIPLKGINDNYQRTFSCHVDTLGAMVKNIKSNGAIAITEIGSFAMNSIEGENCIINTYDNKKYTGTIHTIKPSVHISGEEVRKLNREENTMEIILDEKVFSKEDVKELGIEIGDYVFFDTRTTFTDKGFIKSRHLDDKISTAILLYAISYIKQKNIILPYTTNIFISNYEEVGHGASSSIPEKTVEFISVDMGTPGLEQNSSEYSVCICAKDSSGPYDLSLRNKIVEICKNKSIPYRIDIYPHYGSDASAALRSGWDIKAALIGPGIFASHSYERTHMDSAVATLDLILEIMQTKN